MGMNRRLRRARIWVLTAAALWPAMPALGDAAGGDYSLSLAAAPAGGGAPLYGQDYEIRSQIGADFSPPAGGAPSLRAGDMEIRRGFYGVPHFSMENDADNALVSRDRSLRVTFPKLSVPVESFDAAINDDPLHHPLRIDPAVLQAADAKLLAGAGGGAPAVPVRIYEVNLLGENGFYDGRVAPGGSIDFHYQDNNGFIQSNPPIKADTVKLWMLDESLSQWVRVPDSIVDGAGKTVLGPLKHLSVYAYIGTLDTSVDAVYAFPVPFRPFGPQAGPNAGQTGTEAGGITFVNLPSEGAIEIYTLSGKRVRSMDIPANLVPAKMAWDVRNDNGERAASGVYIWKVASERNVKTGRLMVIW